MSLRQSMADLDENGQIGDWCFFNDDQDMFLAYPDSGRERGYELVHLPLALGNATTQKRWGWDGNKEAPTITPSINVIGHWHGFLRNGKLETA